MPAVSVLMVFHRDAPFLRPAVASVLGQTFCDFELVVVDNGTGLAPEALGELGRDPRLRWVRHSTNLGIAAGHNSGLAAAQGRLVALLDFDDLMLPQRLERQVAVLRADPGAGWCASLADGIDEHGRVLGREFALVDQAAQRRYVQFAAPFFTPSLLGRREVFTALPYREALSFCADFDFVARAVDRWPAVVVPEVLLHYRHHPAQTTVRRAARICAERCAVRLQTARRRAGRPEGEDLFAFAADGICAGDLLRDSARRCLAEQFPLLAAYHARRSVAEERTPAAGVRAGAIFFHALRQAPAAERALVARMFFTGPVRALGLHPAGENTAGPSGG